MNVALLPNSLSLVIQKLRGCSTKRSVLDLFQLLFVFLLLYLLQHEFFLAKKMSAKYFRSFWRLTQVKKMQGIWQKYKPTSEFGNIIRMLFPSELVGCLKRVCLLGFWVEVWGLKRSLRKFLHLLRPLIGWYEKRFRRKDTHPVLHKNCQGAIFRPKIRPMRKLAPQHHIHFFFQDQLLRDKLIGLFLKSQIVVAPPMNFAVWYLVRLFFWPLQQKVF